MKYPKKYESPEAAERHFYEQQSVSEIVPIEVNVPLDVTPAKLIELVMLLPEEDQLKAISELFCTLLRQNTMCIFDQIFLRLTIDASEHLLKCG